MAYLWATEIQVQNFLAASKSNITIDASGNFPEASAQQLENFAVWEIETFLSLVWKTPFAVGDIDSNLKLLAALYTASKIGEVVSGQALGDVAGWTRAYKNTVFQQMGRLILLADDTSISGGEMRDPVPSKSDRLIHMKARDMSAGQPERF